MYAYIICIITFGMHNFFIIYKEINTRELCDHILKCLKLKSLN